MGKTQLNKLVNNFYEKAIYNPENNSLLLKAFPLKILHHLAPPNFGVRV